RETLRVYSSLELVRYNTNADTLPGSGMRIASDTKLVISVATLMRSPQFWADPLNFNPDANWPRQQQQQQQHQPLDSDGAGPGVPRVAWLPFGAGVKSCPGMQVALLMKLLLCNILRKLRISAVRTADALVLERRVVN